MTDMYSTNHIFFVHCELIRAVVLDYHLAESKISVDFLNENLLVIVVDLLVCEQRQELTSKVLG